MPQHPPISTLFPYTTLFRSFQIGGIVEQDPLLDRERQRSVGDEIVVELPEPEARSFGVAIAAEKSHDLPLADHVADLLRRDRKSTRLNSSHRCSSYAVFCLK